MARGIFCCGAWALPCGTQASSLDVARGLSCPAACGILLPWPGIEPTSPVLEGGFLTTGPSGKSLKGLFLLFDHRNFFTSFFYFFTSWVHFCIYFPIFSTPSNLVTFIACTLFLFIYFWPCHVACGILVPRPGIEPTPPALGARSLNPWTTGEVLHFKHKCLWLDPLSHI